MDNRRQDFGQRGRQRGGQLHHPGAASRRYVDGLYPVNRLKRLENVNKLL